MPGHPTVYADHVIWDLILGGRPYLPPETVYVGLSLVRANRPGLVQEPSGDGYRRVAVPNTLDCWPSAFVHDVKSNAHVIDFGVPGDWGRIVAVFVADGPGRDSQVLLTTDLVVPRIVRRRPGAGPLQIRPGSLAWGWG